MNAETVKDLNKREREVVQAIIVLFHDQCSGYSSKVTTDQILFRLEESGIHLSGEAFRQFLGFIRRTDACTKYLKKYKDRIQHAFIVSSNEGYWWSEDLEEMKEFWESQHGRVQQIMMNCHPLYKLFGYDLDQLQFDFFKSKEDKAA